MKPIEPVPTPPASGEANASKLAPPPQYTGMLPLARVGGVRIDIHFSFVLWAVLLMVFALNDHAWGRAVFFPAALLSYCAHQLGHALTARRLGYPVNALLIHPFLSALPFGQVRRANHELRIALSGPAVSACLTILLWTIAQVLGRPVGWAHLFSALSGGDTVVGLLCFNLLLVMTNLVPAFPFDGGKALRAVLSAPLGRSRATMLVVAISRVFVLIAALTGILRGEWFWSVGAIFIIFGTAQEDNLDMFRRLLSGVTVADAMTSTYHTLRPGDTVRQVMNTPSPRLRYLPVLNGDEVVGVLSCAAAERLMRKGCGDAYVAGTMSRNIKTCAPSANLEEVLRGGADGLRTPFLVMDQEKLVGMVTAESLRDYLENRRNGPSNTRGGKTGNAVDVRPLGNKKIL